MSSKTSLNLDQIHHNSHDLVITGIPRSGTSYFCWLLNTLDNFAVINEPQEIYKIFFRNRHLPQFLMLDRRVKKFGEFYSTTRRKIRNAQPVLNKTVQDTRVDDVRVLWTPKNITKDDFQIGTKNTLIYTLSLRAILEGPFRVIALVRHPCDTVWSWSTFHGGAPKFQHLGKGWLPVPHMHPRALTDEQSTRYKSIRAEADRIKRIALLWNFLAQFYIDYAEQIAIVKYSDLVDSPVRVIQSLFGENIDQENLKPSQKKRYEIPDKEKEMIWSVCEQNAAKLGFAYSDIS